MDKVKGDMIVELVWGQVTLRPCPLCGAEYRHTKRYDPRGAVSLYNGYYHCFQCEQGGRQQDIEGLTVPQDLQAEANTKKPYPLVPQIERFWGYCTEVFESSEAHSYCRGRFNRDELELPQQYVRRLPDFALETDEIKRWKANRKLIFPLFDARGNLRSVIGRSVAQKPKIKSLSPAGFSRAGLCLMKEGDAQQVIICEGEMDWLAWTLFGPADATVYGIFSGSLSGERTFIQKHIFSDILIATDLDDAGDQYAEQLRKKISTTCEVKRWAPSANRVNDACDVLRSGGTLEWEGFL